MPDLPVPSSYAVALGASTPTHSEDHDNIRDKVDDAADDITAAEADIVTAQNDITALDAAKVPTGGTTSQVLAKTANGDYVMGWTTVGAGGPVTAADVAVDDNLWQETAADAQEALDEFEARITSSENDLSTAQADITALQAFDATVNDLPAGGTTGQALLKTSNGDYDVGWDDVAGAPTGATYLTATANGTLSNEVVVGATPGGELEGTWAAPEVKDLHAGGYHPVFIRATGSFVTTSDTFVDITDLLSASLPAASVWEFEVCLAGKLAGNTNGVKLCLHKSAGTGGSVNGIIIGHTGTATDTTSTRLFDFDEPTISPGGGEEVHWKYDNLELGALLKGIVVLGDAAAIISPRIKRVSGGTVTVRPSYMKLTRIS